MSGFHYMADRQRRGPAKHCSHCKGKRGPCGCTFGCDVMPGNTCFAFHQDSTCRSCGSSGIKGDRYRCQSCAGVDLCEACYKGGNHPKGHAFFKFARVGCRPVVLGPEDSSETSVLSSSGAISRANQRYSPTGSVPNMMASSTSFGSSFSSSFTSEFVAEPYVPHSRANPTAPGISRPQAQPPSASRYIPRPQPAPSITQANVVSAEATPARSPKPRHEPFSVPEATVFVPDAARPENTEAKKVRHEELVCCSCRMNGIIGSRYMCVECDSYDLCETCFDDGAHEDMASHAFVKFESPGSEPTFVARKKPEEEPVQEGETAALHTSVWCDGPDCGSADGCIRGIRYRCATCSPSLDLCSSCYESGAHDPTHEFHRFEQPEDGDNYVVCPPRSAGDEPKQQIGITCDGCGAKNFFGPDFHCANCDDYDLCSECYTSGKHDTSHNFWRLEWQDAQPELLESRDDGGKVITKHMVQQAGVTCDGCRTKNFFGPYFRCAHCDDFDLCSKCYSSGEHDSNHRFWQCESKYATPVLLDTRDDGGRPTRDVLVQQTGVTCDGCSLQNFFGPYFRCASCGDYDLCSKCYDSGKHDATHRFYRCESRASQPLLLDPRSRVDAGPTAPRQPQRQLGDSCDNCHSSDFLGPRFHCANCSNYVLCSRCYDSGYHDTNHYFERRDGQQRVLMNSRDDGGKPAPPGTVRQAGYTCDACLTRNFFGPRFHCADCADYDLCSKCYSDGKHDSFHHFRRFKQTGTQGVMLNPRNIGGAPVGGGSSARARFGRPGGAPTQKPTKITGAQQPGHGPNFSAPTLIRPRPDIIAASARPGRTGTNRPGRRPDQSQQQQQQQQQQEEDGPGLYEQILEFCEEAHDMYQDQQKDDYIERLEEQNAQQQEQLEHYEQVEQPQQDGFAEGFGEYLEQQQAYMQHQERLEQSEPVEPAQQDGFAEGFGGYTEQHQDYMQEQVEQQMYQGDPFGVGGYDMSQYGGDVAVDPSQYVGGDMDGGGEFQFGCGGDY